MRRRVAIVGGGVAGIAAAIRLAEAGCQPVVIETRPRLGGRATSFVDPRTGYVLDNCQHVVLGCCTNILDLYARLGVLDAIEWHRTLFWTKGHGIIDTMKPGLLPAPLHFLSSLRRMRTFSGDEKKHIGRAMRRILRLGRAGRFQWRDRTFAEFLTECDQPESVISGFWNTVIVSACNLDVQRVGAASAQQVFQEGFLNHRWSSAMGLSTVPLLELYNPAESILREAGGEIRLGESARSIAYDGSRITGVVTGDGLIEASAVISAVPWDRLDRLVSDSLRTADRRLQNLDGLEVSPILGVHLHFDREVMSLPHLILVDRGVHWLFNKGVDERGVQHVHAVISAADAWMPLDEAQIVARVLDDVHHVLPAARGIEPIGVRAVKEKRATFAPTPESDRFRPSSTPGYVGLSGGGVENLFLAGDWCDTGWPATMEGAARSGYAAAHALTGEGGIVEDVPTTWLARALGLK